MLCSEIVLYCDLPWEVSLSSDCIKNILYSAWRSCVDHAVSGCSWYNVLSFCLRDDLIVNDKAGFVWLVNFGYTLIKLGGGGREGKLDRDLVSIQWPQTSRKIVWLLFSFSPTHAPPPAPPTSAIVKLNWHWHFPISQLSADKAQDWLFHSYSAWYVSGSSCSGGRWWCGRGGNSGWFPLLRWLVLFSL